MPIPLSRLESILLIAEEFLQDKINTRELLEHMLHTSNDTDWRIRLQNIISAMRIEKPFILVEERYRINQAKKGKWGKKMEDRKPQPIEIEF